jgi:hypothetical protein
MSQWLRRSADLGVLTTEAARAGHQVKSGHLEEKRFVARTSGRLIRLDRQRFLVQQGALKV